MNAITPPHNPDTGEIYDSSDEAPAYPAGQIDPQSGPRFGQNSGTPALVGEFQDEDQFSSAGPQDFSEHSISPIYDVKMDGPDLRVSEGYKNFLAYQAKPKFIHTVGELDREGLQKAARENAALAFNEGYLRPLTDPSTPANVKKQITDALLERAHGKVDHDVNVKLSGAVGVVTIGSEDIARLIEFANARAVSGDEAVVISE